jgi:polysaccharide biosynthesis transport protein
MNTAAPFNADYSFADVPEASSPAAPHPLAALARLMRGRWRNASIAAAALGTALCTVGFFAGHRLYESQAILRLYPQEANILYRTTDDSVLKTFDSFVKAETSTVASHPVMSRALNKIPAEFADLTRAMTSTDLGSSIEIRRNDSLIVLTTKSKDAGFAQAKLSAVIAAYQAHQADIETQRSDVRLKELLGREQSLLALRDQIRLQTLDVGGEFGIAALAKAHMEKVTQIEALASRRAEVEATLETLKTKTGTASADMQDGEIMRATLLDRALADLNFDRAKREAELSTLQTRYGASSRALRDKREELAVIDRAMAARREQIKVLGQTGALTDTTNASPETSIAEMQALLDKITGQLALARQEARDLNAKRATLASLEEDAAENRALLDETRAALEVIRLESGRALPGYSVVMSPANLPSKAVEDSRKTLGAAGLGFGVVLAFAAALAAAVMQHRIAFSDGITRFAPRLPLLLVSRRALPAGHELDRLRNTVKLLPLRMARSDRKTQVIALAPVDGASGTEMALDLGGSFARTGLKTLVIDAAFPATDLPSDSAGWRDALAGQSVLPLPVAGNLALLPIGQDMTITCGAIGTAQLRKVLADLSAGVDVVLIGCGGLDRAISTELILAESDFALALLTPADRKTSLAQMLPRFEDLPRQGGGVIFTHAAPNDPGLAR